MSHAEYQWRINQGKHNVHNKLISSLLPSEDHDTTPETPFLGLNIPSTNPSFTHEWEDAWKKEMRDPIDLDYMIHDSTPKNTSNISLKVPKIKVPKSINHKSHGW